MAPQLINDCWCSVILFFSETSDYVNLILVVKGLYQHVRTICPHSTRNIEFVCKKRPYVVQPLVYNLNPGVQRSLSNLFQSLPRWSEIFPSLKVLNIEEGRFSGMREKDLCLFHEEQSCLVNLRRFKGILKNTYLKLKHPLPHLEHLDLRNVTPYCHLEISNTILTKLRSLKLEGWRFHQSFDPLRENLEDLELYDMNLDELKIDNYEILRSLALGQRSLCHIKAISNLPKLRNLEFYTSSEDFMGIGQDGDDVSEDEIKSNFKVTNTPNLRVIGVNMNSRKRWDRSYRWSHRGTLKFEDLPHLHTVYVRDLISTSSLKFTLRNTPNLRNFRITGSLMDFRIINQRSDGLNLEHLKLTDNRRGTSELSEDFVSFLPFFKKLRTIKFEPKVRYKGTINIVDFSELEVLDIMYSGIRLQRIRNCPKLRSVSCTIDRGFDMSEVPSLRSLSVLLPDIPHILPVIMEQIRTQKQLRKLMFEGCLLDEDPFDVTYVGRIQHLHFRNCQSINYDGNEVSKLRTIQGDDGNQGDLHLSNHPNLESIDWVITPIPHENAIMNVKKCKKLNRIDILIQGKAGIDLKNLQRCHELRLSGGLDSIRRFDIGETVGIKKLSIRRSLLSKNLFKLRLTPEYFPFLEVLVLEEIHMIHDITLSDIAHNKLRSCFQIFEISRLKYLKLIENREMIGYGDIKAFVGKVEEIDTKKITIKTWKRNDDKDVVWEYSLQYYLILTNYTNYEDDIIQTK